MTQAQVPATAAKYFGANGEHPIIVQAFKASGWARYPFKKRISGAWARKMKKEGVTHVALKSGNRVADFRIEELTR